VTPDDFLVTRASPFAVAALDLREQPAALGTHRRPDGRQLRGAQWVERAAEKNADRSDVYRRFLDRGLDPASAFHHDAFGLADDVPTRQRGAQLVFLLCSGEGDRGVGGEDQADRLGFFGERTRRHCVEVQRPEVVALDEQLEAEHGTHPAWMAAAAKWGQRDSVAMSGMCTVCCSHTARRHGPSSSSVCSSSRRPADGSVAKALLARRPQHGHA